MKFLKIVTFAPTTLLLMLCLTSASCQKDTNMDSEMPGQEQEEGAVTEVSLQLQYPWEIRASGNRLMITEVGGTIAIIDENRNLARSAVQTSSPVENQGGAGLMGLALSSNFGQSGIAYIYYTYSNNSVLRNRIAEINYNGSVWSETRILLDNIPGHRLYNGGRLAIGPDGYLYATTGWQNNPALPQDLNSLAGKILRLDLSGNPAPGNPFPNSYIYSYGHRNPQGLAWSASGELFASEHGQGGNDEVNVISAGGNYGWPTVQGNNNQNGMTAPFVHSGNSTWAPSGIAFVNGNLLVANLASREVISVNPSNRNISRVFSSGDRMRAILPMSNGMYLLTTNTSPQVGETATATDKLLWVPNN